MLITHTYTTIYSSKLDAVLHVRMWGQQIEEDEKTERNKDAAAKDRYYIEDARNERKKGAMRLGKE